MQNNIYSYFIAGHISTLSAEQRKIVHERAESCGLLTQSQGTRYRCIYLYKNKSEIPVTTSISYKTASQTLVTIANRPIEQHQNVDDVIKSKEEKIIEGIACTIEGCEKVCKSEQGLKVHLAWHKKN